MSFLYLLSLLEQPTKNKRRLVGIYGLLLLELYGLFLSNSRTLYVGLFFATLVFFRNVRARWFLLALAFIGACALALIPRLINDLTLINDIEPLALLQKYYGGRFVIWEISWKAFLSQPIMGFGMGNYQTAYYLFHLPFEDVLRYLRVTPLAHNDYLQGLVEYGVVGMVLIGGLAFSLVKSIKKTSWNSPDKKFFLSMLILYLFSSALNFSFFLPLTGAFFFMSLGILFSGQMKPNQKTPRRHLFPLYGLSIILVLFLLLMGAANQARQSQKYALAQIIMPFDSRNWYDHLIHTLSLPNQELSNGEVLRLLDKSLQLEPNNPFYHSRKTKVYNLLFPNQHQEIELAHQRALTLAPQHAPFYIEYGFFFHQRKQWENGLTLYENAIRLEPNAVLPHYLIGRLYLDAGQKKGAKVYLQRTLELYEAHKDTGLDSGYAQYLMSIDPEKVKKELNLL